MTKTAGWEADKGIVGYLADRPDPSRDARIAEFFADIPDDEMNTAEWEQAILGAESAGDIQGLFLAAANEQVLDVALSDGERVRSWLAKRRVQILKVDAERAHVPAPDQGALARALEESAARLRTSTADRLAAVTRARAAGWTNQAIAVRLGISESAVRGLTRRNREVAA